MTIQTGILLLFFILNALGMFFFYLFLRSRFSKNRLAEELRSEVDRLIVDLGREADRDVALLESRIVNLRSLIEEADRRIILADREIQKRRNETQLISDIQSPAKKTIIEANRIIPTAASIPEPIKEEPLVQSPAEIPVPITVYTRPLVKRSEKQIEAVVPLHERVIDMARKGISPEMIASTMSVSLGEVELILDMNNSSL